jgi:hypothetical protein
LGWGVADSGSCHTPLPPSLANQRLAFTAPWLRGKGVVRPHTESGKEIFEDECVPDLARSSLSPSPDDRLSLCRLALCSCRHDEQPSYGSGNDPFDQPVRTRPHGASHLRIAGRNKASSGQYRWRSSRHVRRLGAYTNRPGGNVGGDTRCTISAPSTAATATPAYDRDFIRASTSSTAGRRRPCRRLTRARLPGAGTDRRWDGFAGVAPPSAGQVNETSRKRKRRHNIRRLRFRLVRFELLYLPSGPIPGRMFGQVPEAPIPIPGRIAPIAPPIIPGLPPAPMPPAPIMPPPMPGRREKVPSLTKG